MASMAFRRLCSPRSGGHVGEHRALLAQNTREISQSLEVFLTDRRHDGDVGLNERAKGGNLTGMIRADLHHGNVGVVRDGEQRERNTHVVVEIPARGVDGETSAKGCRRELLRARLAVRPGNRHDRPTPRPAPIAAEQA
jgi:hypothetical protein